MTCIVGLVHRKSVYLGGDMCGSDASHRAIMGQSKVFTKGGVGFGLAGCFRYSQLIHNVMDVPDHDPRSTDMQYLVGPFINSLRECLTRGGAMHIHNDLEQTTGLGLVAYRGKLYMLQSDMSVVEQHSGVGASGSGFMYALGALSVLTGNPEKRISLALSAAAQFTPGVMAPFTMVKI